MHKTRPICIYRSVTKWLRTWQICKNVSITRRVSDSSKWTRRSSTGSRRQSSCERRCSSISRRRRRTYWLWMTSSCKRRRTWPSFRIISWRPSWSTNRSRPKFSSSRTTRWRGRLRRTSVRSRSTRRSRRSLPSAVTSARKSSSASSRSCLMQRNWPRWSAPKVQLMELTVSRQGTSACSAPTTTETCLYPKVDTNS